MQTGKIKFFDTKRGFGFIKPDDGGADVFLPLVVIAAAGIEELERGQSVQYELGQHPVTREIVAMNVRLIDKAQQEAKRAERDQVFGTPAPADM